MISKTQDELQVKGALLESSKEAMESDEEIRQFVANFSGKTVTPDNVDEIVQPDSNDEVSTRLLKNLSKERALEDTLDQLKSDFRKKRIDIDTYLRLTREISERLFMVISKRNKITNFIEIHSGGRR